MDKLTSITAAFDAGKFPTTEQLNAFIDFLSHSIIPAAQPSEDTLSGQSRVLTNDIRKILESHKALNLNKNKDNLLQEAIWHLNEGEINTTIDVNAPSDVVNTKEVSSDIDAVRSSLRTILSIVWQSISSEGSFLFSDFASFLRLALADAAEAVQGQAGRAADGLRDIEQGVQAGQRDTLGRDKKRLEEEEDLRVAFEHGMDTLKDTGSSVIGAGQAATEKTEDISERTTARLQNAYYKACERAQKDPAYRSSLSTLFDTLHKWVSKALDTATDQSFTLDTIIEDSSPEQHLHKAINDLKTLVDRFAQPKSSVDDVLRSAQRFSSAVRGDSVEVKAVVEKFFDYAHKSLDDPKYPRSEEARLVRRDIRQRGRKLLDANTDAGRAWEELKETAQTFGAALAADEDVQRLRTAHAQLGQDVESGLVEAGEQAETGVQAVLERASWFWRDLFTVYAPRMLALLKDIPIPRTEFVDKDTELVLENLDISSFGINPAHIFVRNITDIDVKTSETGQGTTGVGTFTHIRLQAVQLELKDVSFYYNDKTATMPPSEYTGLLALKMPPKGIDVDIKIRLIPSAEDRAARRAYHHIELLNVEISDDVDLDVRESNHPIMLSLFKPIFNMRFRDALGRSLAGQLRTGLDWLDGVVWDVGQRAEVFSDAGLGRGAALTAAVWSEVGRLSRERRTGWRTTGTGVVLEEHGGGAKFAMGAEPQVLSGEKRGPIGTGSETVEKRVGDAIQEVKGQVGAPGDVSQAAKEGAQDVQKHVQGLLREGKKQVNSFQRSVDEKSAVEKRNPGWKSHAFDI
ncbi:hypothetical protein DFH08DRAFT_939527 [Mycena albidolilacea]|uniref:Uncharacterized protein n=1 Tax=Mycena albidolilacea TaxID=1033008 RepID=A0AAD6ZR06_9AGAR|nr:hypothetical protein DFH08DRAFT_939527 [Mycena albidolilacea]